MTPLERAARALCDDRGLDPDGLEPGNAPYADDTEVVDGHLAGGPAFKIWRLFVDQARTVLQAIREPSEAMQRKFVDLALHGDVLKHGGWQGYARDQWQAMIDAALEEK